MHGAQPRDDLEQLWIRYVFLVFASKTEKPSTQQWLSLPNRHQMGALADLRTHPCPRIWLLWPLPQAIDLQNFKASLEALLSTAGDYGFKKDRGMAVIQEVVLDIEGRAAVVVKSYGLINNKIIRTSNVFQKSTGTDLGRLKLLRQKAQLMWGVQGREMGW